MSAAEAAAPVSAAEADVLFADLVHAPVLILAVSGGPDSTALLVLAAAWRQRLNNSDLDNRDLNSPDLDHQRSRQGPELQVVTIDHGLRPESRDEAHAVQQLAERFGLHHRTLLWTGDKPATGLQEAARDARYRLLTTAAREAGAGHVLTAHTLDDQAETILFRMARGSGLTGLCAMAREVSLDGVALLRPLLDLPKARLIATLRAQGIPFVDDPSNRDPRFTRSRLRALLPALAEEGLDARRLGVLARRMRRAEATIEVAVEAAVRAVSEGSWVERGPIVLDAERFAALPDEIALRLLGRAIALAGDEGPAQLGKLESLCDALACTDKLRRTLAGALVTLRGRHLVVMRAPPRTGSGTAYAEALTTAGQHARRRKKRR